MDLERDACGVGFVAHIKGERSHKILKYGVESVCNVTHRGAVDADGKTGDGAGVSTQVPMGIFGPELAKLGVTLEDTSRLAIGTFFLPREDGPQLLKAKELLAQAGHPQGFKTSFSYNMQS